MRFPCGTTIVLREVLDARVRSARPLRVVEDGDDHFVGYLVPRSTVAWPRLLDDAQSQTPDQGWRLPLEEWRGPGALFVIPAGAGFAAVLFFEREQRTPLSWKVDFMRPLRRWPGGFDTLDHAFDLLAPLDGRRVDAKDADDLGQLVRLGLLAGTERRAFDDAVEQARAGLQASSGPFADRWRRWRPEPGWPPGRLPPGWDAVDGDAAAAAQTSGAERWRPPLRGAGRRAASGLRLLDGDGHVTFDLDLDGGAQWLGHARPTIVEAVQRQVALGWGADADHPAVQALLARLAAAAPAGWSVSWTHPDRIGHADRHGELADLDEALIGGGWPVDIEAVCGRAGCTGGRFGPALLAGVGGPHHALVVAPPGPWHNTGGDVAGPGAGNWAAGNAADAVAAVAGLEVLQLATTALIEARAQRAARIRRHVGLDGDGPYLVGPPGWTAPHVRVPDHGRGLLAASTATNATDATDAELISHLRRARR